LNFINKKKILFIAAQAEFYENFRADQAAQKLETELIFFDTYRTAL